MKWREGKKKYFNSPETIKQEKEIFFLLLKKDHFEIFDKLLGKGFCC